MLAIARALMVPAKLILLDEPFEGLAPTIVKEVMDALAQLRGRVAMVIVEHHAETVLPLVDRAYVLVNGRVAFEGTAETWRMTRTCRPGCWGWCRKKWCRDTGCRAGAPSG